MKFQIVKIYHNEDGRIGVLEHVTECKNPGFRVFVYQDMFLVHVSYFETEKEAKDDLRLLLLPVDEQDEPDQYNLPVPDDMIYKINDAIERYTMWEGW